jgi:tellurite resistance protein TehA-like permease
MRFSLIIMLISSWIQPLHTANLATAKIKKFQTVRGLIMLLMIPLSYVALICGGSPEIVFVMQLVTTFVAQIAMLIIIRPLIGLSLKTYTIEVFLKPAIVTILAAIMPIYLHLYLDEGLLSTFLVMATCLISVIISIYFAGLNSIEKTILKSKMKPVLDKITKIA